MTTLKVAAAIDKARSRLQYQLLGSWLAKHPDSELAWELLGNWVAEYKEGAVAQLAARGQL